MFTYKSLADKYDLKNSSDKISYIKDVVALLSKIDSDIEKEIYIGKIAEETGVSKESLASELSKLGKSRPKRIASTPSGDNILLQPSSDSEKKLLIIIAADFAKASKKNITKDTFSSELYKSIFAELEKGKTATDMLADENFVESQSEIAEIFMGEKEPASDLLIDELLYIIKKENRKKELIKLAEVNDVAGMQEIIQKGQE
ncbi:hypothetical protein [Treponema sp. R6D11]